MGSARVCRCLAQRWRPPPSLLTHYLHSRSLTTSLPRPRRSPHSHPFHTLTLPLSQHLASASDDPAAVHPSLTPPPAPSPVPSPSSHNWTVRLPGPFPLSLHPTLPLPYLDVDFSLVGNPAGPTVFIFPSMSHSSHVTRPLPLRSSPASPSDPAGWWEAVVGWGPHYGVDLRVFNVLSASPLGAPFGSSSPLSPDPSGRAYRASFPSITPLDQARCHEALLRHLTQGAGVGDMARGTPFESWRPRLPLYAVVGSSMGGMAAIHFACHFPAACHRVVVICSTPLTSPSTQALRSTQRAAVRMDPAYAGGAYGTAPVAGMKLARMLGTICYRSREEFDERFSPHVGEGGRFPVERYLDHVGWAFGGRYDANCYLLLSECMDRMDVGQRMGEGRRSYEEAVRGVGRESEWLVLPVTEDALIPAEESDRWASALGGVGVRVHHERLSSKYGHDAFLKEGEKLNPRLAAFLTRGEVERSGVESVRKFVKELYGA